MADSVRTLPHVRPDDSGVSGAPIDHIRVARVRRALAEGSYRIDTSALAAAILRFGATD